MLFLEKIASNYFKTNSELEITPQEDEQFQHSTICWLCEASFAECEQPVLDKVRNHDHPTGKYRGAAHNKCKLNCKKSHQVLIPYFSTTFLGMIVKL